VARALTMSRDEIRGKAYLDRVFLGHFVCPRDFRKPNADFHYELNSLLNADHELMAFMWHRGSAKSTFICLIDPLHQIGFCPKDDVRFLPIICETQPQSLNHVARISHEVQYGERFRWLFGDLYTGHRKWGVKEIVTNNNVRVTGLGTGQRVRGVIEVGGRRPTRTYLDDFESYRNGGSPEQRRDNFKWLYADVLPFRDKDIGQIFLLQTPIAHDCIIFKLMQDPQWVTMEVPLYEGEFGEGKVNWPAQWPWDEIKKERDRYKNQGLLPLFDQEYMLKPYKGEGVGIGRDDMRFFTGELRITEMGIKYLSDLTEVDDEGTVIFSHGDTVVTTFSSCDPAIGIARSHDQTAIGTIAMDNKENMYVISSDTFRSRSAFDIGNRFAEHAWDNRADGIGIETVAFQVAIGDVADKWCEEHGVSFDMVRGFNPRSSKDVRLDWLINKFKARKMFMRPGASHLINEILEYPGGAHDDQMDMLYMNAKIAYPPSYTKPEAAIAGGQNAIRRLLESIPSHKVI